MINESEDSIIFNCKPVEKFKQKKKYGADYVE